MGSHSLPTAVELVGFPSHSVFYAPNGAKGPSQRLTCYLRGRRQGYGCGRV